MLLIFFKIMNAIVFSLNYLIRLKKYKVGIQYFLKKIIYLITLTFIEIIIMGQKTLNAARQDDMRLSLGKVKFPMTER